jgi:hypothetical protein
MGGLMFQSSPEKKSLQDSTSIEKSQVLGCVPVIPLMVESLQ